MNKGMFGDMMRQAKKMQQEMGKIQEEAKGKDRKSVVQGKSVDLGGRRIIKKKKMRINS